MAKKTTTNPGQLKIKFDPAPISISDAEDAAAYLEEMERLKAEVAPILKHAEEIKRAVFAYGFRTKADVIQCDGFYFRLIKRSNRFWVSTDADLPNPPPKRARSLYSILKGKTVKVKGEKKKLWGLVTRRVVDTEKLDRAVSKGWISEDEIKVAYIEKPQEPFYQRFNGEAE